MLKTFPLIQFNYLSGRAVQWAVVTGLGLKRPTERTQAPPSWEIQNNPDKLRISKLDSFSTMNLCFVVPVSNQKMQPKNISQVVSPGPKTGMPVFALSSLLLYKNGRGLLIRQIFSSQPSFLCKKKIKYIPSVKDNLSSTNQVFSWYEVPSLCFPGLVFVLGCSRGAVTQRGNFVLWTPRLWKISSPASHCFQMNFRSHLCNSWVYFCTD